MSNKNTIIRLLGLVILNGLLFLTGCNCSSRDPIVPPVARKIPRADTLFGDIRIDNYSWLRDKTNPEVIDYIKAENDYTEKMMASTRTLQEKLYKEMLGRLKETDTMAFVKIDDYYYYSRTVKGQQYSIHCRKKGSLDAPEQILIDLNTLAQGHEYLDLGADKISPDHRYLAYTIDTSGSEDYSVYVKDLDSDKLLDDRIAHANANVEWANDNQTLYYATLDETMRPYRLYRHLLGSDQRNDTLLYEEKDLAYYLNLSKARNKRHILMNLESNSSNEIWSLEADRADAQFVLLKPRKSQVKYYIDYQDDRFFILTNDGAPNYKILWAFVPFTDTGYWSEFIRERDSCFIEGIYAFRNYLVVTERYLGLLRIRVIGGPAYASQYVILPDPAYHIVPFAGSNYDSSIFRFEYSSPLTPKSVYDYNMEKNTLTLVKQNEVKGFDLKKFQMERFFVKSGDGAMIPITIVYKKAGFHKNGNNPALLEGYGAYGLPTDAEFSTMRLSLLNRGFVYAVPQIRGGNEMGREWYDQGHLLNKKNTFKDFVAVAEYLVNRQYTSRENLIITGASAGGLLMGAVTNMQPDLFKAVVAEVPFVDVLNTMLDPSLPLTVTEYEEWGNPHDSIYYEYIKSYSPYDNVEARAYPNLLITGGLNDPRVGYWEPTKWAAKLRALKTYDNTLLLKINMGEGHFGVSGRYAEMRDMAFEYAFMLDVLKMK